VKKNQTARYQRRELPRRSSSSRRSVGRHFRGVMGARGIMEGLFDFTVAPGGQSTLNEAPDRAEGVRTALEGSESAHPH
jgi:hypothetical protein